MAGQADFHIPFCRSDPWPCQFTMSFETSDRQQTNGIFSRRCLNAIPVADGRLPGMCICFVVSPFVSLPRDPPLTSPYLPKKECNCSETFVYMTCRLVNSWAAYSCISSLNVQVSKTCEVWRDTFVCRHRNVNCSCNTDPDPSPSPQNMFCREEGHMTDDTSLPPQTATEMGGGGVDVVGGGLCST